MKYLCRIILLVNLLCGLLIPKAQAQREYYNWYFGSKAGVTFNTAAPTVLTTGQKNLFYSTGCMSDATGDFMFSTDGYTVWDRNWQPMPNSAGTSCVPDNIGTEPVLIVKQPGSSYYLIFRRFTRAAPAGCETTFGYSVVDMRLRNGLGDLVQTVMLTGPLPAFSYASSAYAAVRHANGEDLWIVTQSPAGQYESYAVTAAGVAATPVVSGASRTPAFRDFPSSFLKASPNGRMLASNSYRRSTAYTVGEPLYTEFELAEFSPATGVASNRYAIPRPWVGKVVSPPSGGVGVLLQYVRVGGLEFSPDGSRLYVDTLGGHGVVQYNLLAGSPETIAASTTWLRPQVTVDGAAGLQLGPDGNIYASFTTDSNNPGTSLGRITNANGRGNAAVLKPDYISLNGNRTGLSLPYATNDLNIPPIVFTDAGTITAGQGCTSEDINFTSSLSPFVTASSYTWGFGDPNSGELNTATGQAPTHRYQFSGTYTVKLSVVTNDGRSFSTSQTVQITDCADLPNIITPNQDVRNENFVLRGLRASDWKIEIYNRWGRQVYQKASYDNSWNAAGQPDGVYFYLVQNPVTGQKYKGYLEVAR